MVFPDQALVGELAQVGHDPTLDPSPASPELQIDRSGVPSAATVADDL
jgi:hypothetical protein